LNEIHQTEFLLLHQVQLSENERKYEVDILIGFSFSPVQNELLHRYCFSNASHSLSQHSDGFVFKDVTAFDWSALCCFSPGCALYLSDLMFIIDPSSSPLCDVELCVDLMEESGVSLIWYALNQMLKCLLQIRLVD